MCMKFPPRDLNSGAVKFVNIAFFQFRIRRIMDGINALVEKFLFILFIYTRLSGKLKSLVENNLMERGKFYELSVLFLIFVLTLH